MCDGSEANSAEVFKCSSVLALLALAAAGSYAAREEALAAATGPTRRAWGKRARVMTVLVVRLDCH